MSTTTTTTNITSIPPVAGKLTVSARLPRQSAVAEARQFVYASSFANTNTINQVGQFAGFATSQIEYYVDCASKEASLLMIRVDMSSAFRNVDKGSPASLTIRTGDAPNAITPVKLASQKRIVLYGEFVRVEPSQEDQDRFFSVHPDARTWAPGSLGFHKTEWVEFQISGIYYIGGFGDKHYIGNIPVDMYQAAEPVAESEEPKEPATSESRSWFFWRN